MIRANGPVAVVDWVRFYGIRDEELDRQLNGRKLLSNEEAVQTGLLLCKYFAFDSPLLATMFLFLLL